MNAVRTQISAVNGRNAVHTGQYPPLSFTGQRRSGGRAEPRGNVRGNRGGARLRRGIGPPGLARRGRTERKFRLTPDLRGLVSEPFAKRDGGPQVVIPRPLGEPGRGVGVAGRCRCLPDRKAHPADEHNKDHQHDLHTAVGEQPAQEPWAAALARDGPPADAGGPIRTRTSGPVRDSGWTPIALTVLLATRLHETVAVPEPRRPESRHRHTSPTERLFGYLRAVGLPAQHEGSMTKHR